MPLQTSRKSEKIPPFIPFIMVIKGFRDQLILLFSFSQICDTSHERMGCMRTGSTSGLRAVGSTPPPKTQSSTSFAIFILTSLTGGELLSLQSVDSFITCRIGGTIISESHIMFFNYSSPSFLLLLAPIVSVVFPSSSSSSSSLSHRIPHCNKKKYSLFL